MKSINKSFINATRVACLLGMAALSTNTAHAGTITTGCVSPTTCTLAELFGGGSMQVTSGSLGYLYNNFFLEQLIADPPVNLGLITVTGTSVAGNLGIQISGNGQLAVTNTDSIALDLSYTSVAVPVNGGIHGAFGSGLVIDGSVTGSGFINVTDAIFYQGATLIGSLNTIIDPAYGEDKRSDYGYYIGYKDPCSYDPKLICIEKNIRVGGRLIGDTANLAFVDQINIPEPTTISLLGWGVVGLWLSKRRNSNA